MGHPTACAGALAVQRKIRDGNLMGQVRQRGEELAQRLHERFGNHSHIGDIRGRGLFQAIEIVEERSTKKPFDPKHKVYARIKSLAMDNGLICYPSGGTVDGVSGDHVLLAPPFISNSENIENVVAILGDSLEEVVELLRPPK